MKYSEKSKIQQVIDLLHKLNIEFILQVVQPTDKDEPKYVIIIERV